MSSDPPEFARPGLPPEERYRLYVDESGDHVYDELNEPGHRYLCLLGCWFRTGDYLPFHHDLDNLKQRHFPHNPDEPVVLHREDLVNRRGSFWRLRDPAARAGFDNDLLSVLSEAKFRVVAVVIDKLRLRESYPTPAHPYHLAMGFLLQRYCGFLSHINRVGDVMAESRGGRENRLLVDSYNRAYQRGVWMTRAEVFQRALTTHELKLKPKAANVAGLQLADLLAHPVRLAILIGKGEIRGPQSVFGERVMGIVRPKFNCHLYDGRVEGYGTVFFPK